MVYHFHQMRQARIALAIAIVWVLFDLLILPHIAFYSFVSWCVGILVIAATVLYLVHSSNFIPDNGLVWEYRWRKQWQRICTEAQVNVSGGECPKYRRLVVVYGNQPDSINSMHFEISGLTGVSESRWQSVAPIFAKELKVPHFNVVVRDGAIVFDMVRKAPKETAPLDEIGRVNKALRTVPVGVMPDNGDDEYHIPMMGTHTLIGGKTGAGKGSWIWSMLLPLVDYARLGYVQFFGIDPKCMELGLGLSLFTGYASSDEDIALVLEKLALQMQERGERWRGKARKVVISRDDPLRVIVIDELMYVAKLMTDTELRRRCNQAIMAILTMGRAAGYVMIAAIQDPRKDVLQYRDLFPTRVALRLDKGMVDLILKPGAYENGAYCDEIIREVEAGLGYCLQEEVSDMPVKVWAHWQSDETILRIARGES